MSLIDTYADEDFDAEAVSRIAATFDTPEGMRVIQGRADQPAEQKMFTEWYEIAVEHDITDTDRMNALVLQAFELYYDDAKEQAMAEIAAHLEDEPQQG